MKNKIIVVFSSHLSNEENDLFKVHINDTIGVDHKVVCYENFNQYSLTEIYNKAIDEEYEENSIFVFVHNDIIFKTLSWGKRLLGKFNNLNYQIIGVAGTTYMPESGRWWDRPSTMIGIVEHTNGLRNWVSTYSKDQYIGVKPVVLIDGLFMAVDTDEIVHHFDEDFKGFHHYDTSFCLNNYLDGVNIGVITDIRILHKSVGMTNDEWEKNRVLLVEKFKDELPIEIDQ